MVNKGKPHYKAIGAVMRNLASRIHAVLTEQRDYILRDVDGREVTAREARSIILTRYQVSAGIQATVEDGWVTLRGEVNRDYQTRAAYNTVRHLLRMIGVSNNISIKPTIQPGALKEAIEKALKRNAEIDAEGITVHTHGG
jgi:osmotically-inducible protein OsmY